MVIKAGVMDAAVEKHVNCIYDRRQSCSCQKLRDKTHPMFKSISLRITLNTNQGIYRKTVKSRAGAHG